MKTIYKYDLEIKNTQKIELPKDAEILTVQSQRDEPKLWALTDTEIKETEERFIEIFGTGNPIPVDMGVERKYISTFQEMNGTFIGHVFERIN